MNKNIKSRIILSLLLVLIIVLQTTIIPSMDIFGASLNLPILFVVLISLFRGSASAYGWGLAIGLLLDLLAGKYIGLNMLSLLFCGFFSGMLFSKNYKTNFFIPVAATAAGGLIYSVIYLLLARFAGVQISFMRDLFTEMMPMLIFTAAAALPLYIIVYVIHQHNADNQFAGVNKGYNK